MKPEETSNITTVVKNIADYLSFNAKKHPDKPALLYPARISYSELEEQVRICSSMLSGSGINHGMKTLVMVPAGKDFFILIFSLIRIGAVPVMIDPGMGLRAMTSVLNDLEPEAFIGIFKARLLRLIKPRIFLRTRIYIKPENAGERRPKGIRNNLNTGSENITPYSTEDKDLAAIFYTSGSTGPAKGVLYTGGMLKNQIEITRKQFGIGTEEIDLCTFPLLGLFAICHGSSSVIADMDMVHPAKIDPARVVKNIHDFNCTQMFGSPMILSKLAGYCTRRNIILPSLRKVISAGAPVHRQVLESFSNLIPSGAEIHTPYGATEALPVTDITSKELFQIYSKNDKDLDGICIGNPLEPLDVKIIEITDKPIFKWEDAVPMAVNETGEIVVKGPWVSPGYFKRKDADLNSKIRDNSEIWHRTGDLGRTDSLGRLWFYGRKSHRVETSDRTLFTIPCEAVFNRHPYVVRSALVGVNPDESGLKEPVIIIQLGSGYHPSNKLKNELCALADSNDITRGITDFLFRKDFPVDPRHNAKIFREKLAAWAAKRIK